MILKFTLHHTCRKEGSQLEVLEKMPFPSEFDLENDKRPFLGKGYYFWEFNEDYAHHWGRMHYDNSYYLCEGKVKIDRDLDGLFLDLVGNREQLVGFVELLKEFNLIHEGYLEGIDLCYIIQYLRDECPPEAFPFKIIRAVDYSNNEKHGMKIAFTHGKKGYTFLNPRVIFSFKSHEDIVYLEKPFIKFAS